MAGLIGTGTTYRQQAEALASRSDDLSQRRKEENEMIDQADKQQKISLTTTGAMVGTEISPGWGTLIGAGIGYLAGELL